MTTDPPPRSPSTQNLIEFMTLFCCISTVAGLILLVVFASADPVQTVPAIVAAVLGAAFGFGALKLNNLRKDQ